MRVWFDMDGVLANYEKSVIRVANSLWPDARIPVDYVPSDWNYSDIFDQDKWAAIRREISTIPNFWYNASPIQDNVSALRTWLQPEKNRHEIFYITSRMDTGGVDAKSQTQLWLSKHGLYDGKRPPVVIAVSQPEEKLEIVTRYDLDLGVDDYVPTVNSLNSVLEHKCYLLGRPCNADATNLDRVSCLQEFLDIVDSAAHWLGR